MAKTNRICKTCGKAYYYCPTCNFEKRPTWFAMWDSEKCRDIFMILSKESVKHIPAEEIKKELDGLNVSLNDTFTDSVRKHITRIFDICKEHESVNLESTEERESVEEYKVNTVEQLSDMSVLVNTEENIDLTNQVVKKKRKRKISEEIEE